MSRAQTLYIDGDSIFHKLSGVSKILLFIVWTMITVMFLDIRIFAAMAVIGAIMLYFSQIPWKTIKPLLWIMIAFNLINIIFILLITPQYGSELVGTSTNLINIGYAYISKETLFYVLTISLKYAVLMPITVIFIFTTHPSEFASSLNKIGIPYKIAYAVNIAFRYIPDVQREDAESDSKRAGLSEMYRRRMSGDCIPQRRQSDRVCTQQYSDYKRRSFADTSARQPDPSGNHTETLVGTGAGKWNSNKRGTVYDGRAEECRRSDRQQFRWSVYSGSGIGRSANRRKRSKDIKDITGCVYQILCRRYEVDRMNSQFVREQSVLK